MVSLAQSRLLLRNLCRITMTQNCTKATYNKLVFSKFGPPLSALSLVSEPSPQDIKPDEVHVRVLCSPLNPSDLLSIQGLYPVKGTRPSVPGNEGVVEVVKGNGFKPGDRAIVTKPGWGYWKQEGVIERQFLQKVPTKLPVEAAATLIVNPCTAYLMLKHIVPLQPGDVLIQNGANSFFGQIIIQMAKIAGIKTINVIRKRPNLAETVSMLKGLGADAVVTDEDLAKGLKNLNTGLPAPKLAFECVGGKSSALLASSLERGGTMAVYGILSGQPGQFNQGDFVFRDIRFVGFWMTKWIGDHKPEEFGKVITDVASLYAGGKLQVPKFRKFPLAQWQDAIKAATQGYTNEKVMLQLN